MNTAQPSSLAMTIGQAANSRPAIVPIAPSVAHLWARRSPACASLSRRCASAIACSEAAVLLLSSSRVSCSSARLRLPSSIMERIGAVSKVRNSGSADGFEYRAYSLCKVLIPGASIVASSEEIISLSGWSELTASSAMLPISNPAGSRKPSTGALANTSSGFIDSPVFADFRSGTERAI